MPQRKLLTRWLTCTTNRWGGVKGSGLWFEGEILYSYRQAIAQLICAPIPGHHEPKLALVPQFGTCKTTTTKRHRNAALRTLSTAGIPVIYVPEISTDLKTVCADVLRYHENMLQTQLELQERAPARRIRRHIAALELTQRFVKEQRELLAKLLPEYAHL